MKYPTVIPWYVARRQDRFASRLPIHFRQNTMIGDGVITNLSLEGWTVSSPRHVVKVGDEVVFRLPFDDPDNGQCDARTVVRWAAPNTFGVEVVDQSPASQARLRTWVRVVSNALAWSRLSVHA